MTDNKPPPTPIQSAPSPALRFDWQDWLPYFEDEDIPLDQKKELIKTLWSLVQSFVDIGFHLNPTQIICGEELDLKAILEAAVLHSEKTNQKNAASQSRERKVP